MSGIQAVRGMNDLLPGERVRLWHRVESAIRELTSLYGYQEMRTPVLERTELFKRSIGEQTDIVEKEMYTFTDTGGDSLTLRPEATASCVRAGIQHGLFHNQQTRLWYMGPMFRHERPQKGRYRQFHQFGAEAFGWDGPDVDAELIIMSSQLWALLGIERITLELNSIGSPAARAEYRERLVGYFGERKAELDDDSQRRLGSNPLRILDSKNPEMKTIIEEAPQLADYLDDESKTHFDGVKERLNRAGIDFRINQRLVRGLDYYTRTVFEWTTDLLGAQSAVCGGGRYDLLVEQLGGKPTPATGYAIGLERLIELVSLQGGGEEEGATDIYLALLGETAELEGVVIAHQLRTEGYSVVANCGGGNLKKQMKRADRSGASMALIVGDDEINAGTVVIKPLRGVGTQVTVERDSIQSSISGFLVEEN
ncbi:MAG: histidine--tRNA ligase [Arenicellales bacterium]|jgi:histidyl-tRNA synthetase|nr:histidine--tRNA ligase [Arenicellales bacterium]MDP7156562.1 histidine--tRNA ligase [Arenicellales bacterium]MDP7284050.1 histidine--tRNA ligase [Arenicellales bacterium]MDP7482407.1 histidine--tRNA ligase [Arenicellales bacterium]MEE1539524.1 histidine--tRNA ligase [Arenicellales bacterium]|tara:strand:+ start:3590 stop:4864 length:1275 start_codon:yes stop_codon:yes gene_type:complete